MIVANHLIINGDGVDRTSYTTASISPTANRLVVLSVYNDAASPNIPTVSGASMTWTQVVTRTAGSVRITIFRALSATPGSGVLTIDFAGQTQAGCMWAVDEFSGVNKTGVNGISAIAQTAGNDATGSQTGITVTLGSFSNANNATYGVVEWGNNQAITEGSGFTELGESNAYVNLEVEFKNSPDTSVDWTWSSGSNNSLAIALEIADVSTEIVDDYAYFM
jgi:hypothetical protein